MSFLLSLLIPKNEVKLQAHNLYEMLVVIVEIAESLSNQTSNIETFTILKYIWSLVGMTRHCNAWPI